MVSIHQKHSPYSAGSKDECFVETAEQNGGHRKLWILLLFSRAAHRRENLAVSAQEAVTGGYNSGSMNTGTYCSALVVELQNKIPVDRRPLFPWNHALSSLKLLCSQQVSLLLHYWLIFFRCSSDHVPLLFKNLKGLPLVYRIEWIWHSSLLYHALLDLSAPTFSTCHPHFPFFTLRFSHCVPHTCFPFFFSSCLSFLFFTKCPKAHLCMQPFSPWF